MPLFHHSVSRTRCVWLVWALSVFACKNLQPTPLEAAEREATAASAIAVMPGFEIERLHSAREGEGSWISLTFDPQGRIILSDDARGLRRLTLNPDPAAITVETMAGTERLRHCRGVLYAHDSIYVCETDGQGIYRLRDHDGDGVFEDIQLIVPLVYQSRYGHGANHLRLGPDGMIYVAIGNDVFYPENTAGHSAYRQTDNDWMLPNPHDGPADPRSGFILKISPDGVQRTVLCGGLRNQVDVDFNSDGEMFTWDADMEWDVGMPWYRPTRINHIVPGGEYGWRWGTGKWPDWFPDSLPSNLDTGLGSPAGIAFGTASDWPTRFRESLYGADWQHGRLLLIELTEQGASYQGQYQVLAEGSPLNICDLEFGPDGSLYFVTGGRGTQSGLYRVTYRGDAQLDETPPAPSAQAAAARELRRQLEWFAAEVAEPQLPIIWQHLGHDDHWIRFAARQALERHPVASWRQRVASEADCLTQLTALMALARTGSSADQPQIIEALQQRLAGLAVTPDALTDDAKPSDAVVPDVAGRDHAVIALRSLQLTLIRHGMPDREVQTRLLATLHSLPASQRFAVNWLLGELLVALRSPEAVPLLTARLQAAATQEEQAQYVKTLVRATVGWTDRSRQIVFDWLTQNRQLPGGRLVATTLSQFRDDFLATLSEQEQATFADSIAQLHQPVGDDDAAALAMNRPLVENWSVDSLFAALQTLDQEPRDPAAGAGHLAAALCLRCHRHGDRGSHVGPDLSNVGRRFDRRALLESILIPSAQIDAKFRNAVYLMEDGQIISGRAAIVSRSQLTVEVDQLNGRTVVIERSEIVESKPSDISPMPSGLLDHFTASEIADLIAYLQAVNDKP